MENEDKIIEQRKKAVANFFKNNPNLWIYAVLVALVIFAFWIRTLNVDGLKDITTGNYTLGPDLDPFLFLRWAEYINAHGSIMHIDTMRYVPLGFDTEGEMMFLSYLIVWFHKGLMFLGLTGSIEQSAVYFPAFMFMLTVIAFFLFARRVGEESLGRKNAGIMALIASLFLTIIPSLLPRTIAGIPEKESVGFMFMFLAFYLFLEGFYSKGWKKNLVWGILTGLATAGMALIWGGYSYIIVTIGLTLMIAYLLGKVDFDKLVLSTSWIIVAYIVMGMFSTRYSLGILLTSTITLLPLAIIAIAAIDFYFGNKIMSYFENTRFRKVPRQVVVLVLIGVIGMVLATIFLGFGYVTDKLGDFTKPLINPVTSRFGVTVAENKQPYFAEWANEFGPMLFGKFPLYFWLFIIGAIYLYYVMIKNFEKDERIVMSAGFGFFLFAIIFSRYSSSSIFNGTNGMSIGLYLLGVLALLGSFGYYYYKHYHSDSGKFRTIDISLIMLFALFFFSIVSARGSVRTIMVLVPSIAIIVPYMLVRFGNKIMESKNE